MFKIIQPAKTLMEIIPFCAKFVILLKTFLPLLLMAKYYAGNYSKIKHCG